jgi:SOS response regulatory protein OraA/RecX
MLEQAGLVDDARVAASRARSLAERGYGDAAIRFALEGAQLAPELVAEALAALEPERERIRRLLPDDADSKAFRRLAARGFAAETLEDVAGFANDG